MHLENINPVCRSKPYTVSLEKFEYTFLTICNYNQRSICRLLQSEKRKKPSDVRGSPHSSVSEGFGNSAAVFSHRPSGSMGGVSFCLSRVF